MIVQVSLEFSGSLQAKRIRGVLERKRKPLRQWESVDGLLKPGKAGRHSCGVGKGGIQASGNKEGKSMDFWALKVSLYPVNQELPVSHFYD